MSDIQCAVLLAALAGLAWYLSAGIGRETGASGLLEGRPAPAADAGGTGLRWLAWSLLANLVVSIPFLARPPFSLDDGHSLTHWLGDFLSGWLRWAGLVQLVYVFWLWRRLRATERPLAARTLALAAGGVSSVSILAWSVSFYDRCAANYALQAGCALAAMACAVALLWLGRELRRSLGA